MSPAKPKRVMIIAGEVSGDHHGAKVVAALGARHPGISFSGIGGDAMRAAGVHILVNAHELSVVGITEIFANAGTLLRGLSTAKKALKRLKPDLLVLIDFPDFNLMVAAAAKKIGIPVLYYISPQIWAWRSGRAKKIRKRVDHMAVILPFEADFYHRYQVPATFVGHPLLDGAGEPPPPPSNIPGPTVGLLPGSRDKEVSQLLPEMLQAAYLLKQKIPDIRFLLSQAPSVNPELFDEIVSRHGAGVTLEIETGGVRPLFQQSTLLMAASGTVTLEAAIEGVPTVIAYKVSPFSYLLGRALVRVDYIGLANLISGKEIVPEFIQKEASAENLAGAAHRMLSNPSELESCRQALLELRHNLGGAGASGRVADIAAGMLGLSAPNGMEP